MQVGVKRNLWRTQYGAVKRMNFPINGLVLYAPLWHPELSGSPFLSKDLNAHTCTVTGALWGLQGRTFAGGDDLITATNTSVLDFTSSPFTIIVWLKFTAVNANIDILGRTTDSSTNGYTVFLNGANQKVSLYTYNAGPAEQVTTLNPVSADVWYQIAFSRNGASVASYKNGISDVFVAGVHINPATNGSIAYIGRSSVGAWDYMNGIIGEMEIYNRALSAGEIAHSYQATKWRYV